LEGLLDGRKLRNCVHCLSLLHILNLKEISVLRLGGCLLDNLLLFLLYLLFFNQLFQKGVAVALLDTDLGQLHLGEALD